MQLLESIVAEDVEIVEEGLFQAKVSDKTYSDFKKACEIIADTIKMPGDEKKQEKNQKSIKDSLSKKSSRVTLSYRMGKMDKLKLLTRENINKYFKSYNTPQVNALMSQLRSKLKLKNDKVWIVDTYNGVEMSRSINMFGPIGDDGWMSIHIVVTDYKHQVKEQSVLHISVKPMKDKYMKKYNRLS